ncbi:MAG: cytochrome c [Burkholderiaceae bacterium]
MKRLIPSFWMSAVALAGLATALPAAAQFTKPEDAIKYRKAAMAVMNTHVGRIFAMANGRVPFDAKSVADNAEVLAAVSKWQFSGFVDGSDKGETRAEPKMWAEMDKFKTAGTKSQEDIVKLNSAAKTGDLDAIKAAVGETAKSCKACHDNYRKE